MSDPLTGKSARTPYTQQAGYLRKTITYEDATGVAIYVGTIPAGATILKPTSGVQVDVVFNGGTSSVLDVGTSGNDDLWGTDINIKAALGFLPLDEAVAYTVSTDTDVYCTPVHVGAITTGSGEVIINFIPDNDG